MILNISCRVQILKTCMKAVAWLIFYLIKSLECWREPLAQQGVPIFYKRFAWIELERFDYNFNIWAYDEGVGSRLLIWSTRRKREPRKGSSKYRILMIRSPLTSPTFYFPIGPDKYSPSARAKQQRWASPTILGKRNLKVWQSEGANRPALKDE